MWRRETLSRTSKTVSSKCNGSSKPTRLLEVICILAAGACRQDSQAASAIEPPQLEERGPSRTEQLNQGCLETVSIGGWSVPWHLLSIASSVCLAFDMADTLWEACPSRKLSANTSTTCHFDRPSAREPPSDLSR